MQSCILREVHKAQRLQDLNVFHTIKQDLGRRFSLVDSMEPLRHGDENYADSSLDEGSRKAAHVKWDGKTIALGTFCAAEAAEKCEKAKALTKEWRATMVPKPDVKWVKQALERLNIRVVNDRPGRRKKEQVIKEREEKQKKRMISSAAAGDQLFQPGSGGRGFPAGPSMDQGAASQMANAAMVPPALMSGGLSDPALGANAASLGFPNALPNSNFPSLPNASTQMGRRLSNDIASYSRRSSIDRSAFSTSNPGMGLDDFQRSAALQGLPQASSIAGLQAGSVMGNLAQELGHVPSPSRRHYHVLKEHHDNLLKELQQTTYMMEMYQNTNFEDEPDNSNMMGMNSMLQNSLHDMNMDQRRPSFDSRRLSLSMNNPALGGALPYDFANTNRRDSLGMNEFQSRRDSLAALSGMNTMNAAMGRPVAFNQNAPFHLPNPGMMNQGSYGAGQGQGQGRNMMRDNASTTDSGRRPSPGSSEAQSSAKRTKLSDNAGNKA